MIHTMISPQKGIKVVRLYLYRYSVPSLRELSLSYLVHQLLDNFIKIKLRSGVAGICVRHLSKGKDRPGNSEEKLNNICLATPFLTCRSELEPLDRQV